MFCLTTNRFARLETINSIGKFCLTLSANTDWLVQKNITFQNKRAHSLKFLLHLFGRFKITVGKIHLSNVQFGFGSIFGIETRKKTAARRRHKF